MQRVRSVCNRRVLPKIHLIKFYNHHCRYDAVHFVNLPREIGSVSIFSTSFENVHIFNINIWTSFYSTHINKINFIRDVVICGWFMERRFSWLTFHCDFELTKRKIIFRAKYLGSFAYSWDQMRLPLKIDDFSYSIVSFIFKSSVVAFNSRILCRTRPTDNLTMKALHDSSKRLKYSGFS